MIVVTYHRVARDAADASNDPYVVDRNLFEAQFVVWAHHLAHPAVLTEPDSSLPAIPRVILTVDDGNESDYEFFFHDLMARGLPSFITFILSERVGTPGHVSGAQLREMAAAGVCVGSHGIGHHPLVGLSTADVRAELHDSKRALEDIVGSAVTSFSFPFGQYGVREIELAREAGYDRVFTSDGGEHRGWTPGLVNRKSIQSTMPPSDLQSFLADPLRFESKRRRLLARVGGLTRARALHHRLAALWGRW